MRSTSTPNQADKRSTPAAMLMFAAITVDRVSGRKGENERGELLQQRLLWLAKRVVHEFSQSPICICKPVVAFLTRTCRVADSEDCTDRDVRGSQGRRQR